MAAEIVLASASPRRRELLALLGVTFTVRVPDIDETPLPGEASAAYVERLAAEKAEVVARPGELVIAADTTVVLDRQLIGKPADARDAASMLRSLAGRRHHVVTGVAVARDDVVAAASVSTAVTMAAMTDAEIDWYVSTGEPMDKAGAYAMQGIGGVFVERIDGSPSSVIGLPLAVVVRLAREAGVDLLSSSSRSWRSVPEQ